MIDILSLVQQRAGIALVGKPTRNHNNGVEYHSNCPLCNAGRDRFAIWPDVGRYYCRVCGKFGDAISFLREYENMSFQEACSELGIDPRFPEEWKPAILPLFMTRDEAPNKIWMENASFFVHRAQRYLWSEGGKSALEYLYSRGLTDDTIKRAMLGFCPGWFHDVLENWGLASSQTQKTEIKIPEGIIIPWSVDNAIWKIQVRRRYPEDGKKFFEVTGSSDCLYNIDTLQPGSPAVLVESEIDALSVQQEASHLTAAIATGGASKGISARWIARLLQASHILISFDQDAAGEEGAAEWLRILPDGKAMRWLPFAHDVNQMLQEGPYISSWVVLGFNLLLHPPEIPQPELPLQPQSRPVEAPPALSISPIQKPRLTWEHVNERGLPLNCSCHAPAVFWQSQNFECKGFCEKCRPPKQWYELR